MGEGDSVCNVYGVCMRLLAIHSVSELNKEREREIETE